MLEEASKLLRTPTNAASSTGSEGRPQETGGSSSIRIQESLQRAQNMLRNSSSTGLCRRLKRPERLRATSSTSYQQGSKATSVSGNSKKAKKEDKVIEFALLRCLDDDDEEEEHIV